MTGDDCGVSVNEWVNVVRRAQLGRTNKLVALVIASYADPDGTRIFPGVARLAVQAEVDHRTARRALAALRAVGLIEVARRGNRRGGKSDEYRLILADDLLERCDVPAPAAEQLVIQKLTEQQRNPGSTGHKRPVKQPVDNHDHRTAAPHETRFTGQGNPSLQGTGAPPPSIDPYLDEQPPSDETSLDATRTGIARESARSETGISGHRRSPRTAEETAAEAMRQADELTEWARQHPDPEAFAS